MTNWIVCKLDEICDIFTGNSINEKEKFEKYTNISTGYNYIGTKDIGFDQWIDYDNGIKIPANDLKFKIAPKGSVLLCIEGGSAGRKIGLTRQNVCFGNKLCAFVSKIDNKYIFYFLQTSDFRNIFSYNKNGLIGGVSVNKLKNIEIPLPPLAEQGRIVAKIEELFAGIDAGVENLKAVKNQIALYRQSVLKSAFNIKNAVIQKASEIGEVSLGRQRSPKNISKFYPTKYIRAANISENGIDVSDILDMEFLPYEKEKYLLKQNDILLSEASGSPNQVGKPAIWNNEIDDCCFQNTVIRHRLFSNHPKYVFWFYKYLYLSSFFAKLAGGVGINHIGSTKFSNIEIPIPSLDEQKRIVAEIESRFERADALETAVDRALSNAEKLKQAVLKKAFSGELVPQNPDDEPASVLLDRIRAARASELPAKKGKRKKTEVDSQL